MSNRSFAESVIRRMDPDNMLGKNSRHLYKKDLVKTLDDIEGDLNERKRDVENEQLKVIKFARWAGTECPVLMGLAIFLHEDGGLQPVADPQPCSCGIKEPWCHEYLHEYELKIRMKKGRKIAVDIHYVFSQTQVRTAGIPEVTFGDREWIIRKNVVQFDCFRSDTTADVKNAIMAFMDAFCSQRVAGAYQLPNEREESPTRY